MYQIRRTSLANVLRLLRRGSDAKVQRPAMGQSLWSTVGRHVTTERGGVTPMSPTRVLAFVGLFVAAVLVGYLAGAIIFPRPVRTGVLTGVRPPQNTVASTYPVDSQSASARHVPPPSVASSPTQNAVPPPPAAREVPPSATASAIPPSKPLSAKPVPAAPAPAGAGVAVVPPASSRVQVPRVSGPAPSGTLTPGPAPQSRVQQSRRPQEQGPSVPANAGTPPAQASTNPGGDLTVSIPISRSAPPPAGNGTTPSRTAAQGPLPPAPSGVVSPGPAPSSSGSSASTSSGAAAPQASGDSTSTGVVSGGVTVPTAPPSGPEASGTPPPTSGTASPAPSPERFHVQVGSFDVRPEADQLARRLQQRGYSTAVTQDAPYRVWVGGYLDRSTAERLAQSLQQLGFAATLVP